MDRYTVATGYNCCGCCSAIQSLSCLVYAINEQLCNVESLISRNQSDLYMLYATLATNNPMSVAAEYPSLLSDKVLYSTSKVRFLDMLNPNLVVLFKGAVQSELPTFFRDRSGVQNPDDGYQHIVTVGDENTPMIAKDIINNYPYPALYVGNYIILNPTQQTLDNFKDGTLT